jgi:hypothetical protein
MDDATPARRRLTFTTMLVAAMVGFAEALGWERPSPDTVEVADGPIGDDGPKLDFGHLDPLDP